MLSPLRGYLDGGFMFLGLAPQALCCRRSAAILIVDSCSWGSRPRLYATAAPRLWDVCEFFGTENAKSIPLVTAEGCAKRPAPLHAISNEDTTDVDSAAVGFSR